MLGKKKLQSLIFLVGLIFIFFNLKLIYHFEIVKNHSDLYTEVVFLTDMIWLNL